LWVLCVLMCMEIECCLNVHGDLSTVCLNVHGDCGYCVS
jgi:hypothetical protein